MATGTADAKTAITRAALHLFAEHGVTGVSSRQILRDAGQRNSNALQYHFGDRGDLIAAVVAPFQARVDDRRDSLLDALEATGRIELHDMAGALVRPSVAMLDVDGGREYLRILAELNDDPARALTIWPGVANGTDRWVRLAASAMPDDVAPLHRRFAAVQLAFSELRRRARTSRSDDHRLFEADLIDLVSAVLSAQPSPATRQLLAERTSRPGRQADAPLERD